MYFLVNLFISWLEKNADIFDGVPSTVHILYVLVLMLYVLVNKFSVMLGCFIIQGTKIPLVRS